MTLSSSNTKSSQIPVEACNSPAFIKKNAFTAKQKGDIRAVSQEYMKLLNHPHSCLNDKLKAVRELTSISLNNGNFHDALQILKNGLTQSGSARILRAMIHLLIDNGYYDLAMVEIRQFQPKTKVQECICRELEAALILIETKVARNRGEEIDTEKIVATLRKLYANNLIDGYKPEESRSLYFKAGSWFGEPLTVSNRSFIEESLVAYPDSAFFNYKKAEILVKEASSAKNYKEALPYAEKAVQKKPREPGLWMFVAEIHYKLNNMTVCQAALETAVKYTQSFQEFGTSDFELITDFYHYKEEVGQMKIYGLMAKSFEAKKVEDKARLMAQAIFTALSSRLATLAIKITKSLAALEAQEMPVEAHEAILAVAFLERHSAYEKTACQHIIANSKSVNEGLKRIGRVRSMVEKLKIVGK